MAIKKYKPTTPGQRNKSGIAFRKLLSGAKRHKPLSKGGKRSVGRNSQGKITTRHKGGGHKRVFREIDFYFLDKCDIPAKVDSIEYDPNRSAFISLVCYRDGERRYVIVPQSVKVGDEIITSEKAGLKVGNRTLLSRVPIGAFVYNVELKPKDGAKIARSAGVSVEIVAIDGKHALLKMPSSEIRKVSKNSWATIGEVSNPEYRLINSGKAGRSRWLGIRPTVRGFAMSAYAHPYGGGEGRTGVGHKRLRTKWGKPAGKGQKTRSTKKYSDKLIVERRKIKRKK